MQEIQIVDALSGAGKTYAALEDALSKANIYQKILFVQPSIKLIEQSLADCPVIFSRNIFPKIPRHLKVRAIHSLNSLRWSHFVGQISSAVKVYSVV